MQPDQPYPMRSGIDYAVVSSSSPNLPAELRNNETTLAFKHTGKEVSRHHNSPTMYSLNG
jgi:hypothetical protein